MDSCDTSTFPVPSCSLETVEHQITELAAHIHAANYRLVHEGGYGVRVCGNQQFAFTRPDGRLIEHAGTFLDRREHLTERRGGMRLLED